MTKFLREWHTWRNPPSSDCFGNTMVPVVAISQLKCQLTSEFGQALTVFWSNNRNYFSIFLKLLKITFIPYFFMFLLLSGWLEGSEECKEKLFSLMLSSIGCFNYPRSNNHCSLLSCYICRINLKSLLVCVCLLELIFPNVLLSPALAALQLCYNSDGWTLT